MAVVPQEGRRSVNIQTPEKIATLQVIAVQHPAGRGHPHVRVFGYRVGDPKKTVVEVALHSDDAVDLIEYASTNRAFPEIEIADRYVIGILNTDGLNMIHIAEEDEGPRGRGA